ncbi:MAG: hypothetical protein RPS47_09385 [Colwellia sp.]|jgi:hypothetical protein
MKRIATLSNTTQSSGDGIPEAVRAENIEEDFILSFLDSIEKLTKTKPVIHHELSDIYATMVS